MDISLKAIPEVENAIDQKLEMFDEDFDVNSMNSLPFSLSFHNTYKILHFGDQPLTDATKLVILT